MPIFLCPNLMLTFRQVTYTRFCGSSIQTVHAIKIPRQYVHIFEINLLEYHTCHKLPVKIYMKIRICRCTVLVEICAAILLKNFCWQLLAPCPCAAPPSNHHKLCNHNAHFGSTAQLDQTGSSHYFHTQNITPL